MCVCVCLLTGSAGLLGHGQGDLGQREDVDFGAILRGGRGQGGEIRLVLLSLCVLELLVQGHTLQLVTGGRQWPVLCAATGTRRVHKSHTLYVASCASVRRLRRGRDTLVRVFRLTTQSLTFILTLVSLSPLVNLWIYVFMSVCIFL